MPPTPFYRSGQSPCASQILTVEGHGPAVDAAPLAGRVAEGRGPAREAVAVLIVVADLERGKGTRVSTLEGFGPPRGLSPPGIGTEEPQNPGHTYPVAITLLPAAFRFKEGGVPALPLKANLK